MQEPDGAPQTPVEPHDIVTGPPVYPATQVPVAVVLALVTLKKALLAVVELQVISVGTDRERA